MKSIAKSGSSASRRGFLALLLAAVLCVPAAVVIAAQTPRSGETEMAEGKAVYEERCAICHYADSTAKKMGPGMKGLYLRGKFADGKKVDDPEMTRWIEIGGKDMPGFKGVLKPAQMRALVAYLKSL